MKCFSNEGVQMRIQESQTKLVVLDKKDAYYVPESHFVIGKHIISPL